MKSLIFHILIALGLLTTAVAQATLCDDLFAPVKFKQDSNILYKDVVKARWELNEYGLIYRQARALVNRSENAIVEYYNAVLDYGPSRNWITALERLGQMPMFISRDPNVTWSDLERFIISNNLMLAEHPARESYLKTNRDDYTKNIRPGFDLAMKEYLRRKWFTPEFRKGAEETFKNTLDNATYILVRDPNGSNEVWGVLRLVQIHNGKLTLTDKQTGRKLEILGNAEIGWGVDGTHRVGHWSFQTAFDVERLAKEFLESNEAHVKTVSGSDPIEMIKLPMELALDIEVPRNYERVDLTQQDEFQNGAVMTIAGREFELEYEHAVVVEPGLFAIDKQKDKTMVFSELMLWLGRYLASPNLPQWVDEKKIGYWTYNDLPLYKPFGFEVASNFTPINKYGVTWDIYSATPQNMNSSIVNLGDARTKGSERWLKMREFLNKHFN